MDTQIRISGGDEEDEYFSLYSWLRNERALAGRVNLLQSPPAEGDMGSIIEMLTVALGSGGTAALASALTAWIKTRRPNVKVAVKTPVGSVEVQAQNIASADVLPMIERITPDSDGRPA